MPRDAQDDLNLLRSLKEWLRDKPKASFVLAAIDPQENEELDVSLQLSRLTAYHLVGLIEVLIEHTIGIAEEVHGGKPSAEVTRLRQALAALNADPELLAANSDLPQGPSCH